MEIRLATSSDLPGFSEIEVDAGRLFADVGMDEIAGDEGAPVSVLAEHQAAGHAWVAEVDGTVVGYLIAMPVDGCLHVEQISVRPAYGRRGIGAALLEAAAQCALAENRPAMTLTTFVEVSWNAPYYARHGYRLLGVDELTPGLQAIREREAAMGLDKWPRAAMRRDLP
ncbi:GNAT family N-acetyltransferase [Hamadaea sp. NPDC051192]|uniref:GNAT family N-acetyltransferase n=1 Tax=Hamadaea sp. NPDC051192 TaxID=3154940 RepID=UPI0034245629